MISITYLTRYNGTEWQWEEHYTNPHTDEVVFNSCHTNLRRDGLWINGRQILGTCQFYLSNNYSAAYSRIRRRILKDISP